MLQPHKIVAVVKELAAVRTRENISTLAALAATNSELRGLCLPYLFSHVRWPHPDKYDEESGLHFFPESLWPLFKRFDLIWPDDWPDASPPRWGDRYYVGGDYHPRHTDKLATALPRMPSLISFSICCPFFPPNSLFNALLTCTSVRELRMTDTPLYISMIPKSPPEFVIERLFLIPVAEAPRVGQGPYEARYSSPTLYHSREYRKKYKNDILARYAASAFLFDVGKPTSLTHVQVSGDLCTLDEFAQHDWPRLESLVMTGHPPRQTGTELVDVIRKMPKLKELRLLFAKSAVRGDVMFKVMPAAPEYISSKGNHGSLLEQIENLAVSDACTLDRVGYFMKGVKRLAILAISDIADPANAFTKPVLQKMLIEVSAAGTPAPKTIPPKAQPKHGKHVQKEPEKETVSTRPEFIHKNHTLKHLRVMLGERIEPEFCKFLADRFPKIEVLEVEQCNYQDGRDVAPWSEYVKNLKPIRRTLRSLRLGMQFEEQESLHESISHQEHISVHINDDDLSLTSPSTTTISTLTSPTLLNAPFPITPSASTSSAITSSSYLTTSTSFPSSSSSSHLPIQLPIPKWRLEREKCAHYFAKTLGQLTRVGFEYRKRPGPHRMDDRWLDWEIERRRFTADMQKEWEVRREKKLVRVREEREREREEREREREERERESAAVGKEGEREEGEGREGEREESQQQAEEPINKAAATVTRRTSTATTTSSISTTPSLTTPLSHPSSQQNLALVREQFAAGIPGVTGSPFSGGTPNSTSSYMYQSSPSSSSTTTTTTTTGYPASPDSQGSMSSPPVTTTMIPRHRMSSSVSSTATATGITGIGGLPSSASPAPIGADRQDYFMNFRASSTFGEYNSAATGGNATGAATGSATTPNSAVSKVTTAAATTNPNSIADTTISTLPEPETPEPEIPEEEIWDSDDEDPEGILGVYELRPGWYPFPECWKGKTLWEEEEVADAGGYVGEEGCCVALETGTGTDASAGVAAGVNGAS